MRFKFKLDPQTRQAHAADGGRDHAQGTRGRELFGLQSRV